MKKVNLKKPKPKAKAKPRAKKSTKTKSQLKLKNAFYSGFCLTDNKNFALFNIEKQFLVDNDINYSVNFKLTENDLNMMLDRSIQLKHKIDKEKNIVVFSDYGQVDMQYFKLFKLIYLTCIFVPVIEWNGNQSNRLIAGLPNKQGKPIGVLKTIL